MFIPTSIKILSKKSSNIYLLHKLQYFGQLAVAQGKYWPPHDDFPYASQFGMASLHGPVDAGVVIGLGPVT